MRASMRVGNLAHKRACREFPGELERIMVWFRDYKIPDNKPPNAYGYQA